MNTVNGKLGRAGKLSLCITAIALLSLSTVSPVLAADETKFSLSLGVFVTDRDSETRLDVADGLPGTPVDIEKDLGANRSDSVFRLDAYYRFNEKHRFDFSAFDLSRTSSKLIEKEIDWQGTIFPISTTVEGEFDLNIYKLAYTYSIMRREKGYLGLTAGVYVAEMGNRLSGENIGSREGGGITAPLPVVGLRGEHRFSDRWSFRASGEFFSLKYQEFDGSLIDLYAGVDYRISDHVAIGLGLNSVRIDVGIDGSGLIGNLDWRYDGGLLFLKFDF